MPRSTLGSDVSRRRPWHHAPMVEDLRDMFHTLGHFRDPQKQVEILTAIDVLVKTANVPKDSSPDDREMTQVIMRQEQLGRKIWLVKWLDELTIHRQLVFVRIQQICVWNLFQTQGHLEQSVRGEEIIMIEQRQKRTAG